MNISAGAKLLASRNKTAAALALLALLIAAVYAQTAEFNFVTYDDEVNIVLNPRLTSGSWRDAAWFFTHFYDGNWIPLNWLSHFAAIKCFGLEPGAHHWVNVLLHLVNTFLLFFLLKKMTADFRRPLFVAALFALHPLHVESAAWISERKDVLSGMFWMAGLLAYAIHTKDSKRTAYFFSLLFFACGLASKPMLVSLPVVLLLLDDWPLERFTREKVGHLATEKIPFFFLSALSCVLTCLAHQTEGWLHPAEEIPWDVRITNAAASYLLYLKKTFWPADLAVFYPYERAQVLFPLAIVSVILLGAFTFWIIRNRKARPYLFTGWIWYLVTLFPVIGIVSFGGFSMADRFTYLPLTGIFIMIAWGVPDLLARWKFRDSFLRIGAAVVIFAASLFSWFQAGYWPDSRTLFKHAVAVTHNNYFAHIALGDIYTRKKNFARAAFHYERAVMIRPDPSTLNNLGTTYFFLGRADDAIRIYESTVKDYPAFLPARKNLDFVRQRKKA